MKFSFVLIFFIFITLSSCQTKKIIHSKSNINLPKISIYHNNRILFDSIILIKKNSNDITYSVKKFHYKIMHKNKLLCKGKNKSSIFDNATKDNFKKIYLNDLIIFKKIILKDSLNKTYRIKRFKQKVYNTPVF